MTSYHVSQKAYAKIAFHAAKYPHRQVNGVLIGNEDLGSVRIVDAIPLLHHWTSLSPSMGNWAGSCEYLPDALDIGRSADECLSRYEGLKTIPAQAAST